MLIKPVIFNLQHNMCMEKYLIYKICSKAIVYSLKMKIMKKKLSISLKNSHFTIFYRNKIQMIENRKMHSKVSRNIAS